MSASADRVTRRDIRRAVGAEAVELIAQHDAALAHHADTLKAAIADIATLIERIGQIERDKLRAGLSLWARLRWLMTGQTHGN